ncbi:hypothetical protein [Alienimonas californiensis]|uniref:Uncharacterized protein n=1 Tax=Alienimonas californiensis TaxID=2527989 RepID=A0A517PEN0_9PLAN|nr:hypothetical protein [Alienimonas californiensis]QDT17825.1 hypothetical protein CA12_39600 [Alienimonas californiensis]
MPAPDLTPTAATGSAPERVTPGSVGMSRRLFGAALAGAASFAAAGTLRAQEAPATDAAESEAEPLPVGGLTEESLGALLAAIGLKPSKEKSRYDFQFKTTLEEEQWDFTMSAVLSRNLQSLWVMAWLDELPKTAAAVPRSALLKMLAANDRMGNGKFFAYIPANRRFVLQRVVANEEMSNAKVRGLLIDLGRSVRSEYGVWSTEGWIEKVPPATSAAAPTAPPATRISANDPNYGGVSRN